MKRLGSLSRHPILSHTSTVQFPPRLRYLSKCNLILNSPSSSSALLLASRSASPSSSVYATTGGE